MILFERGSFMMSWNFASSFSVRATSSSWWCAWRLMRLFRPARASRFTKILIGRLNLHLMTDAKFNVIKRACVIAFSEESLEGLIANRSLYWTSLSIFSTKVLWQRDLSASDHSHSALLVDQDQTVEEHREEEFSSHQEKKNEFESSECSRLFVLKSCKIRKEHVAAQKRSCTLSRNSDR